MKSITLGARAWSLSRVTELLETADASIDVNSIEVIGGAASWRISDILLSLEMS